MCVRVCVQRRLVSGQDEGGIEREDRINRLDKDVYRYTRTHTQTLTLEEAKILQTKPTNEPDRHSLRR